MHQLLPHFAFMQSCNGSFSESRWRQGLLMPSPVLCLPLARLARMSLYCSHNAWQPNLKQRCKLLCAACWAAAGPRAATASAAYASAPRAQSNHGMLPLAQVTVMSRPMRAPPAPAVLAALVLVAHASAPAHACSRTQWPTHTAAQLRACGHLSHQNLPAATCAGCMLGTSKFMGPSRLSVHICCTHARKRAGLCKMR